jgi:hypothetical protein
LAQILFDRYVVPKSKVCLALVAALACKVVYKEGCVFVEQHTDEHLAALGFDYLKAETEVRYSLTQSGGYGSMKNFPSSLYISGR